VRSCGFFRDTYSETLRDFLFAEMCNAELVTLPAPFTDRRSGFQELYKISSSLLY
jgi:hypothetical protein